jgi:two-component system LytT family response regulator
VFRVLIVDDEPLARKRIRRMLSTESDMAVVAECADGLSALMAINDLSPDLVFLDVQMPEMDGLEVIRAIGPRHLPALVFATTRSASRSASWQTASAPGRDISRGS